jgi:hypothetical protein
MSKVHAPRRRSQSNDNFKINDANYATVTGATGQCLAKELRQKLAQADKPRKNLNIETNGVREALTYPLVRKMQSGMQYSCSAYDEVGSPFFTFFYDVLQLSSGRDKLCAFVQNFAKFASDSLAAPDSERHLIWRSVESDISSSRKVFKLFKWIREVYKIRRGIHRIEDGKKTNGNTYFCIDAVCGMLDTFGRVIGFNYFVLDNIVWAVSVGLVQGKQVPSMMRSQDELRFNRKNGLLVRMLGGITGIKRNKNIASLIRSYIGIAANMLLLYKAVKYKWAQLETEKKEQNWANILSPAHADDAVFFHIFEICGTYAGLLTLFSKLKIKGWKQTHTAMGILGMFQSATGIWRNWRKVIKKNCGAKQFPSLVLDPPTGLSEDCEV